MFQNSELVEFMSLKLSYFPELVRVFYNNLKIQDGVIYSEVHQIPIIVDQSLFYSLTKLSSQGVPFEGTLVENMFIQVMIVRQVASDILRRGVELRYSKLLPQFKKKTISLFIQVMNSLNDNLLKY